LPFSVVLLLEKAIAVGGRDVVLDAGRHSATVASSAMLGLNLWRLRT
jgi:hypothetical protein